MFKKINVILLITLIMGINSYISAQWNNEWSSPQIPSGVVSGWLNFQQSGSEWQSRMYVIDSLSFSIMQAGYTFTPQYVYSFTSQERLAGNQIYSLGTDLNGDNITEFYILGYEGATSPFRQTFKIIDITSNNVLFEKNEASYYYTAPSVWDIDNDGVLELVYTKYDYPNFANYSLEVFNTGVTSISNNEMPQLKFELEQNYPNPFNPSTTISYTVNQSENVVLEIFDIKGERIKTLINDFQKPGEYNVTWDGTSNSGGKLASGVYFYSVRTGNSVATKKMLMLK